MGLISAGVVTAMAGTAGSQSNPSNFNLGGGPMADAIADLQIKYYVGAFDERPSAGVEGRVFEVQDDEDDEEHGAVYFDDGEGWELVDRKVRNLEAETVATEVLNSDQRFVEASDWDDDIQAALDNYPHVVVYGSAAEFTVTAEVPDDTTLERWGGHTDTIPDTNSISEYTIASNTWRTAITNDDHSNGNEGITVKGFTLDYDAVDDSTSHNWAGLLLNNITGFEVRDFEGKNIIPSWPDTTRRHFGIGLKDATGYNDKERARLINCTGRNCGYNGIRIGGDSKWVTAYGCNGYDNNREAIQVADWTPGNVGVPEHIRLIDCAGNDSQLNVHGNADNGPISNIEFLECDTEWIEILEEVEDVTVRDCTLDFVDVRSLSGDHEITNFAIENNTFLGDRSDNGVQFEVTDSEATIHNGQIHDNTFHCRRAVNIGQMDGTLDDISVKHNQYYAGDFTGGAFIRNAGSGTSENWQVHGNKIHNTAVALNGPLDTVEYFDNHEENVTDRTADTVTNLLVRGVGMGFPANVAADRSAGTTYQNDSDYPIMVYVSYVNSGAGNRCVIAVRMGETSPAGTTIFSDGPTAHDSNNVYASATFVVQPGNYYQVDTFGSGISKDEWREQTIGA